jgi:hypothetical protein
MSSSKKIDLKRDFAAGVYLSEPRTPYTLYACTVYSIFIDTGKGGRGEL